MFLRRFLRITFMIVPLLSASLWSNDNFPLRTVVCKGNKYFSTTTVVQVLSLKEGAVYSQQSLNDAGKRLIARYAEEGFLDAFIDSIAILHDSSARVTDVEFFIHEGKQSVVDSLELVGDPMFTFEMWESICRTVPGKPFIPEILEQDIRDVLSFYDKKGFPFARIVVDSLAREEHKQTIGWRIVLLVEKRQQVTIDEIRVEGLKTTKEKIVRRESRLRPRQMYTSELPQLVQKRLNKLGLFSSVSEPELFIFPSQHSDTTLRGGLKVRVTEGNSIFFDGVVGYVPSSDSKSKGYVTGLVSLQFGNLFGTARSLGIRWSRERALTQDVEIHYNEPWLFSYPINLTLGLTQRKQDSTYIRNYYTVSATYMFTEEFSVGASGSITTVNGIEGYGKSIVPSSQTNTIGASIRFDTRDNLYVPTEGYVYYTSYSTGKKHQSSLNQQPASKSTTQQVVFDGAMYKRIVSRQILAVEAHLRSIFSSLNDITDMYLLGGATTLRGYREGQFLGSKIIWGSAEYRFLFAPKSYFFVFADAGYYYQPENNLQELKKQSGYPVGYGGGVSFNTAIGFLGVSLAFGKGDTFSTAKLHVRVSNGN